MKVTKFFILVPVLFLASSCSTVANTMGDSGLPTDDGGSVIPGARPTISSVTLTPPASPTGTVTLKITGTGLDSCDFDLNGDKVSLAVQPDASSTDKTANISAPTLRDRAPLSVAWLRATRRVTQAQSEPYLFSIRYVEQTKYLNPTKQGTFPANLLGFTAVKNDQAQYGALSVSQDRSTLTLDTDITINAIGIADVSWIDMNKDGIVDLVYLTIGAYSSQSNGGYPMTAYIHYGTKSMGKLGFEKIPNITIKLSPDTDGVFGGGEPKCSTAVVQGKLLVADLDNDGRLDIGAQWFCAVGATSQYSWSYQSLQKPM